MTLLLKLFRSPLSLFLFFFFFLSLPAATFGSLSMFQPLFIMIIFAPSLDGDPSPPMGGRGTGPPRQTIAPSSISRKRCLHAVTALSLLCCTCD